MSSLLAGLGAGAAGAGTLALMTGKASQLRERVVLAASGLALGVAGALRRRERAAADRRRQEVSLPAPARPAPPVPPAAELEIPGITPLFGRLRLAAAAGPAWRRQGYPRQPAFAGPLPPARRGLRQLLPSRP